MKDTLAIVGGGIAGASAAYYLVRAGQPVIVFDEGRGQATQAACGIINPWFSARKNKAWYLLARQGAEFYRRFQADLNQDGYPGNDLFQVDGALMIRRSDKRYQDDLDQAPEKRRHSPSIGQVKTVHGKEYFPWLKEGLKATYVEGGGRVDGKKLIDTLHQAIQDLGGQVRREKAQISRAGSKLLVQGKTYPATLLAVGAWLPILLEPLGYEVAIYPQKGQLFSIYDSSWKDQHWPVVMPPGRGDIIPFNDGRIILGASQEKDKGYDLSVDPKELDRLEESLAEWAPQLMGRDKLEVKVGIRAQSFDHSPVLGPVPDLDQVWTVSGLGTSGLTTGPYIGYQWAQLMLKGHNAVDSSLYPIEKYIRKNK